MCIKSTLILEGINWIVNRGGGNKVDYKVHRIWIGCSVNASRYNSNDGTEWTLGGVNYPGGGGNQSMYRVWSECAVNHAVCKFK